MSIIGIIAGSGQFPFLVARGAKKMGHTVVAVGFDGNTDEKIAEECSAYLQVNIGQVGKLIEFLKAQGVTQLCMAGAINKPKAVAIKPDFRATKMLFKLAGNRGDDAILRLFAEEIKSEGIEVVKPEVLVPSLLHSEHGLLAGPVPTSEQWEDIILGWEKAKAIGLHDIGQCVAVCMGAIVAVEAIEGTDALIRRAGELISSGTTLVKVFKPRQDERLDKPSLGSQTIQLLVEHKFACLAFEAGKVLFFDREESLRMAHEHGISVIAIPEEAEAFFAQETAKK